jgi:hypothetical protein
MARASRWRDETTAESIEGRTCVKPSTAPALIALLLAAGAGCATYPGGADAPFW